jgi:hypothetical protein
MGLITSHGNAAIAVKTGPQQDLPPNKPDRGIHLECRKPAAPAVSMGSKGLNVSGLLDP